MMPDFGSIPVGWVTDRYEPHAFNHVGTCQSWNNLLGIQLTSAEGFNTRPSGYQYTFYNTQGDWSNSPFPIPGVFWLPGSGLVGLAGLRMKFEL